ncbi:TPA: inovirus-type Gp2 protein [Escherichia coli]|uniref:YagK/YfjJ domain-containing protein n=1 Tax=Enterobacteriaceae TaxID=543 RepID=UPI0010CB5123|nr:inovirus-type Gp2 protein [Escherichia coli]EEW1519417.1 inovirus Gp2 family protein [Escherichia coli]EGI4466889.1 inovirus Gp2 family protein [Escherichia coli]EGJ4687052.1 inovirus Gp2 family protein [Escherichia coli]EGJ4973251.1 inovirus Gp2 family protein [Escherichia coli]EGJ4991823.1 inovirus Gp2 family protein [Escherichia coli]
MQQSSLSTQQPTNLLTSHRDNGHYTLIHSSTYLHDGLTYKLNHNPLSKRSSPIRKEIIDRFIDQLRAMLSHYNELYGFRFDLSVPEGMSVDESNKLVSELFSRLRGEFTAKAWNNQPIKKFAYGWVREKERAKQVHYHCWIALPYFQVNTAGFEDKGIIGRVSRIWSELTNGVSRVHLPEDGYRIKRGDHDSLAKMVKRISYLAKNRGKYSNGKGQQTFSASRVKFKTANTLH